MHFNNEEIIAEFKKYDWDCMSWHGWRCNIYYDNIDELRKWRDEWRDGYHDGLRGQSNPNLACTYEDEVSFYRTGYGEGFLRGWGFRTMLQNTVSKHESIGGTWKEVWDDLLPPEDTYCNYHRAILSIALDRSTLKEQYED